MITEVKENELYWSRVKPNATIPSRDNENGWYDVYACFDEDELIFNPFEGRLVPTGIATAFSPEYRMKVAERGSNSKSKLAVGSGCIDSGYRGEWFINLRNTTNKLVIISKKVSDYEYLENAIYVPYSKAIAQVGVEAVPVMEEKEIPYSTLLDIKSKRGTGALGSSGK